MTRSFFSSLVFLISALPLAAAPDFNSGNFGTVGMSNTIFLFTPTGGIGPYVFSYAPLATPIPNFRVFNAPELPNNATAAQKGGLTGLPLTSGLKSTTIRLTDTATSEFVDKAVSFTVSPVDLAGFGPGYYAIGDTVSQRFWPVGGTPPYSYTLSGTLPPGLSLGTQVVNGVTVALVSGTIGSTANTATTAATNQYNFTITIRDSASNTLGRGYSMVVSAMQLWVGGSPLNGSSVNRTLPAATVGLAYSQQITVVGGTPPYTFALESVNSTPSPITMSSSGLLSGTPTGSNFGGRFTFDVTDSANHFTSARVALHILPTTPVPLTLSTNIIGDGAVGDNGDWGIYASGGLPPYTFDIDPATPLPAGAAIIQGYEREPKNSDPDPAYIRTRIQTPGTYTFTVRVTDSAGNRASRAYTLNTRPLTVSTVFPGTTTLGVPYSRYLIPEGGTPPYTVTAVNIPAGLAVDNIALLSGTPQEAGSFLPLVFTLADSAGNQYTQSQGNFSILSSTSPGLTLSGGDFGVAQMGSQYASGLSAGGSVQNPPVFTVTLVSGTLPPGLRLLTGSEFNNGGNTSLAAQLAGIPNTPGVYTFVYRVVDGFGQVGQRQIKLRISGMAIVNTAFAPATVGVSYTQTVDVRGGTAPYTFSLTTGSLPPGLSFNTSNGTISGTPLSTTSTTVTIQVRDGAGDLLLRNFALNIYPIQITGPDVLPNAFFGNSYNYTFTPNPAGSYTFTGAGLPAGLTLNANTGLLSGIPTATGAFTITVTAFNNVTLAVVVRSFTLFVPPLSGIINGLPTGVVIIGGVPTAYLGDFVARTNLVTTLGVAGGRAPYTVSLVPPSTLPPGLALAIGSIYQGTTNFNRWTIAGVPTTAGLYTFTLRYTDADGLTVDRVIAMNITTLGLATTAPAIGIVNQPYTAQLYATGGSGTYTFAVADIQGNVMPAGLALSPTGQITGTPTSTGAFATTIQLTSGGATRRVGITTTINATADNRRIDFGLSLGPLPAETSVGNGFPTILTPTGVPSSAGTHTWSLVSGTIPPGLQLLTNASLPFGFTAPTALLAGATTTLGTYNYRIRVDDSTGNFGIRDAALFVSAMRPGPNNTAYFGGTTFPPGQVGSPYSFTLSALNYRAPLSYTTETGTLLPPGMTLSAAGVLSGTPTAGGNFPLFYHRTDADGVVRHASTTINVYPAGSAIPPNNAVGTGAVMPSGTLGAGYTFSLNDLLSTAYGTPPFTWTLFSGTPPPGLSITPGSGLASATLSGTPTSAGAYVFSLRAADSNGRSVLIYQLQLTASTLGLAPPPGALPPAIAGIPYLTSFTASGGTPPYTFTKEYGSAMPAGFSLSPAGVLSGTTSLAASFNTVYIIATDAVGNAFRQRYTLNISPVGTVVPAFTLTPQSINISYTRGDQAPAPIPISVGTTSTALSYTASAGNTPWLSVSALSGNTPGAPNAIITPGSMPASTYNGAITFTSAAASNSPASIPVTLNIVNAVVCSYFLSPTSGTAPGGGGGNSFSVFAPPSCVWAVDTASLPNWITVTPPASGTGNGVVNFSVAANPGPSVRTGNISVNGIVYTVSQFGTACSFSLLPQTISSLPSTGGSGLIAVNASDPACPWTFTQIDPWISVVTVTPSSGRGSGSASLSIAPNISALNRTGAINIAGQVLTVNEPGVGCAYSLNSAGIGITSVGGPASFGVNAPPGCAWSADTGPGWISPTSATSGVGNGTVNLSIAPSSTTVPRIASVLVAGRTFQVNQAGVPCNFSLSANNPVQPAAGGTGSVDIVTGAGCNWTASTNNTPWITLGSNSGTGGGTLNFSVGTNPGALARSATLTIVGQNITVNQSGPVCNYSLQSPSATVPGGGSSGSIGVITAAACGPWNVSSNAPSWLHVTGAGSYSGPADATYSVDPNLTGADRFGTLTVAGQTFAVTEPALVCPVTLGTPSTSQGEFGGSGQFTFTTTPPGCNVTIQSYTSWITLTDLATPGTVQFAVAPNTFGAARSGSIAVGGQSFMVNQAPSTCAYTLTTFAATFSRLGGDGAVPMTFSPFQCGAPPVLVNGPAGMITLGPVSSGAGTYTQNYNVGIYQSFINYARTTQMLINGQIFTVKQTSW